MRNKLLTYLFIYLVKRRDHAVFNNYFQGHISVRRGGEGRLQVAAESGDIAYS